jgi:hypothetical protein
MRTRTRAAFLAVSVAALTLLPAAQALAGATLTRR